MHTAKEHSSERGGRGMGAVQEDREQPMDAAAPSSGLTQLPSISRGSALHARQSGLDAQTRTLLGIFGANASEADLTQLASITCLTRQQVEQWFSDIQAATQADVTVVAAPMAAAAVSSVLASSANGAVGTHSSAGESQPGAPAFALSGAAAADSAARASVAVPSFIPHQRSGSALAAAAAAASAVPPPRSDLLQQADALSPSIAELQERNGVLATLLARKEAAHAATQQEHSTQTALLSQQLASVKQQLTDTQAATLASTQQAKRAQKGHENAQIDALALAQQLQEARAAQLAAESQWRSEVTRREVIAAQLAEKKDVIASMLQQQTSLEKQVSTLSADLSQQRQVNSRLQWEASVKAKQLAAKDAAHTQQIERLTEQGQQLDLEKQQADSRHAAELQSLRAELAASQSAHAALLERQSTQHQRLVAVKREVVDAQADAHGASQQAEQARVAKRRAEDDLSEEAKRHRGTAERLQAESSALSSRVSELLDERQCAICAESAACAMYLPCGHLAGCEGCASEWHQRDGTCPSCRLPIAKVQRIFFA